MNQHGVWFGLPVSFLRFGLVGIGGLGVDVATLYAAMGGFGLGAVPARVVSFFVAATFTWWMNRRYTFKRSGKSLLSEWGTFLLANAFGGLVNFGVYTAVVMQGFPYAWLPALATGAGSLSGMFFNYTASRRFVFAEHRHKPAGIRPELPHGPPPLPWTMYPLALSMCLLFGWLAMRQGADVGGAFASGPAAGFRNPGLDAFSALLAGHLPARAVGFLLGMLHGLNFLPLFAIAWRLSVLSPHHRLPVAATLAVAGLCGAGGLSGLGAMSYDNALSLGVSASAWLVLWRWDALKAGGLPGLGWALAAGLPVGLAVGLQPPLAVYGLGLCAAFLLADMAWPCRLRAALGLGLGLLLGFALGGGHWAWQLWQVYGTPLPCFNPSAAHCASGLVPHGWLDRLLFVYRFSFAPALVGEAGFRDFRILALVTLTLLAGLAAFWRKPARLATGPAGWLLAAGMLAYALWQSGFAVYRYLVPLEMLAPPLAVAALVRLPLGKARPLAAAGLVVLLAVTTVSANRQTSQPRLTRQASPVLSMLMSSAKNRRITSALVCACWVMAEVVNAPPPAKARGSSNWSARCGPTAAPEAT